MTWFSYGTVLHQEQDISVECPGLAVLLFGEILSVFSYGVFTEKHQNKLAVLVNYNTLINKFLKKSKDLKTSWQEDTGESPVSYLQNFLKTPGSHGSSDCFIFQDQMCI